MNYTIEVVTADTIKDIKVQNYIVTTAIRNSLTYGQHYGPDFPWWEFPILMYVEKHRVTLCRRDGEPVGIMLAQINRSVWTDKITVLYQDLLYAEKGTRAARLLMIDFIDFGRRNANHILTCIAENTNIKESSLLKLGFEKLETLYRIEV